MAKLSEILKEYEAIALQAMGVDLNKDYFDYTLREFLTMSVYFYPEGQGVRKKELLLNAVMILLANRT
ncbi:hypothetical protein [Pedobacter sp. NJ-S-72]